jgi:hypothetical protein
MAQVKQLEWNRLFAFAPATSARVKAKKCTCGNGNCRTAKRILCTCSCHNVNHGAANREGMPRLETLLQLDGLEIFQERPWFEIY